MDTTGMEAGAIHVMVTVSDGLCVGSDTATIIINSGFIEIHPIQLASCNGYKALNDTHLDDVCKAFLEDATTRLRLEPAMELVIQGFSEKNEKSNTARFRAERVRSYLVRKGIDSKRIRIVVLGTTRSPSAAKGNKVVMLWLVPGESSLPY